MMGSVAKRRHLPERRGSAPDPLAAWHTWVSDGMHQHERDLSPFEESTPSALILVPLLGLPALVVLGFLVASLLG
jgi:hypothetical protein